MSENGALPAEPPRAVVFEGILDGRVGDAPALQAAAAQLSAAGAGQFRCDIQGGRFSLFPAETHVPGALFDAAAQQRFLDALHTVLRAAAPGTVEANLRCRLVWPGEVAETLFVVRGDRVEPVTRRRPNTAADDALLATAPPPARFSLPRREVLVIAPLLLLAGLLVAWRTGWIDRVLAARAEQLTVDAGPFAALIDAQVGRSWGNYEVTLRRGAEYPATPQALAELVAKQDDNARRAACNIVGDGDELFVQIVDAEQNVLVETKAGLRPLLSDPGATVVVKLSGRMNATAVRLSLAGAPEKK